jgi:hypothetical protein
MRAIALQALVLVLVPAAASAQRLPAPTFESGYFEGTIAANRQPIPGAWLGTPAGVLGAWAIVRFTSKPQERPSPGAEVGVAVLGAALTAALTAAMEVKLPADVPTTGDEHAQGYREGFIGRIRERRIMASLISGLAASGVVAVVAFSGR